MEISAKGYMFGVSGVKLGIPFLWKFVEIIRITVVINECKVVNEQAFISDLFGKLRERMVDLRSGKVVFVGGGSVLLEKQIRASGKVNSIMWVKEITANTKGYELLYKASCMG